jgi:hypothetical protein
MAKNFLTIFVQSVIIGALFVSLYKTINNSYTILFIAGMLFYLFFEMSGLNAYLYNNTTEIQVVKNEETTK